MEINIINSIELLTEKRYKQISGYDEYYITETGEVYACRNRKVGWQGIRKLSPKGVSNPNRYLQVCLSRNKTKKYHQIHRLVASAFCDGYFAGAVVNHKDGNIHNNDYRNLEWVSQKENIHKSYLTSGKDQTRNFYTYNLISPDGEYLSSFRGRNHVMNYLKENNIHISFPSLVKYGVSKGYRLEKQ